MLPMLVGAVLAIAVAITGKVTRFDQDRSFYPTILVVIAAYYVLFAAMSGESIVEEILVAAAFSVAAIVGALKWPVLVGVGIFLHGVFDFLHPSLISNSGVPAWWPAFCAAIDIPLGAWVIRLAWR